MAGERLETVDWGKDKGSQATPQIVKQAETMNTFAIETLKEKKEPSLGELNPLLFPPDLSNSEAIEAITLATTRLIDSHGGVQPNLRVPLVASNGFEPYVPRLVARFETDTLTEEQLSQIEAVANQMYGSATRTRKNQNGNLVPPSNYPGLENKKTKRGEPTPLQTGSSLGWYMGANPDQVSTAHEGILVHRDLGSEGMAQFVKKRNPQEWFFKQDLPDPITGKVAPVKYNIEVREASSYQTNIVETIVQISTILAKGNSLPHKKLLYEVYNDLNRLGLKRPGKDNIYGLDETIDYIERVLFTPLANLNLSASIDAKAGNILTVGVPGTGKTLIAEHFLAKDTGVLVVPVDPSVLAQDMAAPPEKKVILPRISEVFNDTNIPIVIHMDDIENIAEHETQINSTLLNLMAGVRESGFYVMASTNHPERLSPQLIQPQRFAHLIHFGLPPTEARKGILDIHALQVSKNLQKPLFSSPEERGIILDGLAEHTEGYTARFLAEICTRAKYHFLKRVTIEKTKSCGLTEEEIDGITFQWEDWAKAYDEVSRIYDKEGTVKRDKELKEFVDKHNNSGIGFTSVDANNRNKEIILATFDSLAAARLKQ